MTETLTGRQVLALLAQDEVPEIEFFNGEWVKFNEDMWSAAVLRNSPVQFRIKPAPARRLSVTLANGEVVSWPEPVRKELIGGGGYWCVNTKGEVEKDQFDSRFDRERLKFGNIHLTREAAQEHADALRKINTQGVV